MKKLDNYLIESLNQNMGFYFKAKKSLESIETPYQNLEIYETSEYGRILRLDGIFQTSDRDEFLYHEPLIHVPTITMGAPRTALVIGGGDGGSIEELLKYACLEKVVMVELDEIVVQKSKEYFPYISKGAFGSDKLELRIEDGMNYVSKTKESFDQIVLDLTDAFGPSLNLYTKEFYESLKSILSKKGILSLHMESPIVAEKIFKRIYATLSSVFKFVRVMLNYVPLYGSLWGFAVVSDYHDPLELTQEEIAKRISKHNLHDLKFYDAKTHRALLVLPHYIKDILGRPAEIITSKNKVSVEQENVKKLFIGEAE